MSTLHALVKKWEYIVLTCYPSKHCCKEILESLKLHSGDKLLQQHYKSGNLLRALYIYPRFHLFRNFSKCLNLIINYFLKCESKDLQQFFVGWAHHLHWPWYILYWLAFEKWLDKDHLWFEYSLWVQVIQYLCFSLTFCIICTRFPCRRISRRFLP